MLYQTANYQIKKQSIEKVKKAIVEFTKYVKENEPETLMYIAWQEKDDQTSFIHFFIFKNKEAQEIHGKSPAVKKFESIYTPELLNKGVKFTDYTMISTKQSSNF
jgi:quinol monooxygenase YgiN